MGDLPLLLFSWVDVNDNLATLENTADNLENLDGLPQLMDANLENTADNLKPSRVCGGRGVILAQQPAPHLD